MRKELITALLCGGLVATAPSAGASQASTPTGSEVTVTLPSGDVHVDEGMLADAVRDAATDAVGVTGLWGGDGLTVTLDVAGTTRPTVDTGEYALSFTLLDLAQETPALVAGAGWYGFDGGFGLTATGTLEECGGSIGSGRGSSTVTLSLPTDCLGETSTVWLNVQAFGFGALNFGDTLMSGDEALYDTPVLAVLHAPGTEPAPAVSEMDGPSGDPVEDEDGSPQRIVWSDEDGTSDLEQVLGGVAGGSLDLLETEVVDGETAITVTNTFAGDVPSDLILSVVLGAVDQAWFASSYIDFGEMPDEPGFSETLSAIGASFSRPQDWGLRSCRARHAVDGKSVTTTIPASCPVGGTFEEGFVLALATSGEDVAFDDLYGTTSWVRKERPLVARPTAREIGDTCDDRPTETTFPDIDGNVHAPGIRCIASYAITQGRADGNYGPKDVLTRGQIATFVVRTIEAAGLPLGQGADVCPGEGHVANLDRLVEVGIMEAGDCDVVGTVTRSQMAQITLGALRHAGAAPSTPAHWFTDDRGIDPFVEFAHDAVAEVGIVTGTATLGHFSGDLVLRRDQMGTFLARLLDAVITP